MLRGDGANVTATPKPPVAWDAVTPPWRKPVASRGRETAWGCWPGKALHPLPLVTQGKRYAFLPFLYNDEGARNREKYRAYLETRPAYMQS